MLLCGNALIAKEGPYVVIVQAFWYPGDLIYCGKQDIVYIYIRYTHIHIGRASVRETRLLISLNKCTL